MTLTAKLLTLSNERLYNFDISPDFQKTTYSLGNESSEAVLIAILETSSGAFPLGTTPKPGAGADPFYLRNGRLIGNCALSYNLKLRLGYALLASISKHNLQG